MATKLEPESPGSIKKRICFIIPGFGEGGAQRQCILLLNELMHRDDYELHLIYFYEGVYWDQLNQNGLVLHKGAAHSMWSFAALMYVIRSIRSLKPDLVFSWLHSCDVFTGIAKIFLGGFKWVMAERNSFYPREIKFVLREYFAKYSDVIACNSTKGLIFWKEKGVGDGCLTVHDNILYLPAEDNESDVLENELDFLYAGRLESQKNVLFLTEVFNQLSTLDGLKCGIVGGGSLRGAVMGLVESVSDDNRIHVFPFQKHIFKYYRSSKVFVSLSLHEGMPNTVIENVRLGKRVVVSKIQEHVEILGPNYPYYWIPGTSVNECVELLRRAINDAMDQDHYSYVNERLGKMSAENVSNGYSRMFLSLIGEFK